MARPLGDYFRAAEDAWLAKSIPMFRTSLNLQDYLRDHAAKAAREQANPPSMASAYRNAGLAISGTQVGFSGQRLQEAAQQQWRTIEPQSSRHMEYTMMRGHEAANVNQPRRDQDHGQER